MKLTLKLITYGLELAALVIVFCGGWYIGSCRGKRTAAPPDYSPYAGTYYRADADDRLTLNADGVWTDGKGSRGVYEITGSDIKTYLVLADGAKWELLSGTIRNGVITVSHPLGGGAVVYALAPE